MADLLLLFFGYSDKIIGTHAVKLTKQYKIVYLKLCPALFNMTVPLLRFVYYLANLFLRQISVLTQISHPRTIIHDKQFHP